jgi:hypothetical protein
MVVGHQAEGFPEVAGGGCKFLHQLAATRTFWKKAFWRRLLIGEMLSKSRTFAKTSAKIASTVVS